MASAPGIVDSQAPEGKGHGETGPFPTHEVSRSPRKHPSGNASNTLRVKTGLGARVKRALVPQPPSLVIFPAVAVAVTLFMSLLIGITSAQVSGDLSGALGAIVLVVVSLPIALLAATTLSVILPYGAFASSSTVVALLSSYSPYVLGALTGIWAALWLGKLLPFGYDSLATIWRVTIATAGPVLWLSVGLLSNHLAVIVERRKDYEKGMDEFRESRQRMVQVHEQLRKEVAGLLHGRVQSRMVVLGHWLKECQERAKDGPKEVVEGLESANRLLQEIRDQELRSITRQLYPSIIRTGLPSALNSLADRFRTMFEVELGIDEAVAEMESPVRPLLNESVRLTVYRVAEEALNNVAKHSHAEEARVGLSLSEFQELLLEIRDNGHGFDSTKAHSGHGRLRNCPGRYSGGR